jgi:carboxymethylenebutenolidase
MSETVQIPGARDTVAYRARPAGGPQAAVLVIHEAWGLAPHIKTVADRLAAEGYLALAPNLLSDTDIERLATPELQESLFDPERRHAAQPRLRELMAPLHAPDFAAATSERLQACFEYLFKLPESHGHVAVWGFCFGGSYSFSLAIQEPKLALALPFYGHSDQPVRELARIKCPVRAFYGANDENLMKALPALKERMNDGGVDFESKVYNGAGHAFFNDSNRYAYNAAAATDSWNRVKELLAEYLV